MRRPPVRSESDGGVLVVTIDRPERRNAVDRETAELLAGAFARFEEEAALQCAVLTGEGGTFCAGADLVEIAEGRPNRVAAGGAGPMGPTRLRLSKPVIAAIEGHAVAGGLELAVWCDLRVAGESAVFGVVSRRRGVPLVDGGTVRLPRVVGMGRALDLVLTGRQLSAGEALSWGLVDRVVTDGRALPVAVGLAAELAAFPQACLRNDRASCYEQWGRGEAEAMDGELELGLASLASGEAEEGARRFVARSETSRGRP